MCVCASVLPLSISRWVLKDCSPFSPSLSFFGKRQPRSKYQSLSDEKCVLHLYGAIRSPLNHCQKKISLSLSMMKESFKNKNYQCRRPPRRRTPFFTQLSLLRYFLSQCANLERLPSAPSPSYRCPFSSFK